MSPILTNKFTDKLVEAGVLTREQANRTYRLVIDFTSGEPVKIYREEYGQKDAMENLAPMLKGMIPDAEADRTG